MALIIRCSLAPSRPNFIHTPRLFPARISSQINQLGKLDFEVILHSGMVKILKHASLVRWFRRSEKVSHKSLEMDKVLRTSLSLLSKPNDSCMNTLEGTHATDRRLLDFDSTEKHVFAIQRMVPFTHPTKAFFVLNALMLMTPFEAVAETCEAANSAFNMPLLLIVALIGATVGGLVARQRKGELQRLNGQLRQINAVLRRQATIESYAPALSYAPVGSRIPEDEVIVDSRKHDLLLRLKSGKNLLRNQDPGKAFVEFKTALELAQDLKDPVEEKKAARGLGASLQRQGKYKDAINYHSLVLAISKRAGEDSGNTEAYGAIADCYTELGDLEKAANFYDQYIATLESE